MTADDGEGGIADDEFELTVTSTNTAPVVAVAIQDQTATVGVEFDFTVPAGTFTDADADDVLSYSATLSDDTQLPQWLAFDASTQRFLGTPADTDVGAITVKVTVDDAEGGIASDEFELTVTSTNNAPVVAVSVPDQAATTGVEFDFTVPAGTFTDADAADVLMFSATLSDGTQLPPWLAFDASTQTFLGTRADADVGTITVKVTADDGHGGTASDEFEIVVSLSSTVEVVLDVDRTTDEPKNFAYLSEDDGVGVSLKLKGGPGTTATLTFTRPGPSLLQRLVSAVLRSPEPGRTIFSGKSKGSYSFEQIDADGAKRIDMPTAKVRGNGIVTTGLVSQIRLGSIADGSQIQVGGSAADPLKLAVRGPVGTPGGPLGVSLVFPGHLKSATAAAWHGGLIQVASLGQSLTKGGDFSPAVSIAGGFSLFKVLGGDFLSPEFRSGTADANNDGDAMNDRDGDGGTILVKPDAAGNGGRIVSPNSIEIDGGLRSMKGSTIDAKLTASGLVMNIQAKDPSGTGQISGTFTAERFGKIKSHGADAMFDLMATGSAAALGTVPAVNAVQIKGADWVGGRLETQPGTRIKQVQIKPKAGAGGVVRGPMELAVDLIEKFTTGDILADVTHRGDMKAGSVGRIVGSTFHITGNILQRLRTKSQRGATGVATGTIELLNPPTDPDGTSSTRRARPIASCSFPGSPLRSWTTRSRV